LKDLQFGFRDLARWCWRRPRISKGLRAGPDVAGAEPRLRFMNFLAGVGTPMDRGADTLTVPDRPCLIHGTINSPREPKSIIPGRIAWRRRTSHTHGQHRSLRPSCLSTVASA